MGTLNRVCLAVLFVNFDLSLGEGGPDAYGYYWESTQCPGDTIRFAWVDPSLHQAISDWDPDPDDGCASVSLPYGFPYYGETLRTINVCTNGFLQFPTSFTTYRNCPLPVPWCPSLFAVFWDDLCLARSGDVRFAHDTQQRFTAITWNNVIRHGTYETLSCQVQLYADGRIRFNYLRVPAEARSSTIGIQGHAGAHGNWLQYVFNGQPCYHVPVDSTSVCFFVRQLEYDVGISLVLSPNGWTPAGCQVPVAALLKNFGLSTASFPARALVIRTRLSQDTVFDSYTRVTCLAPGDTTTCYFGDFVTPPSPDSWLALLITCLGSDQYRRNDTLCTHASSFVPAFGASLDSWRLWELGEGWNLLGITCREDSGRFYLCLTNPNRVVSFPGIGPQEGIRGEPFELQSFLGDDIAWGISWDRERDGFWLTHSSESSRGSILARYNADGSFAGDTWDLSQVFPNVWFAGIDQDYQGMFWATEVGSDNRLYRIDPSSHTIRGYVNGQPISYRACSFLGDRQSFLFTGGWNEHCLVKLDHRGEIVESSFLPNLADLDIYHTTATAPESLVWAFATHNDEWNTLSRLSMGMTWGQVGISEYDQSLAVVPCLNIIPNPSRSGIVTIDCCSPRGQLELFDAAGRCRLVCKISNRLKLRLRDTQRQDLPAGVYLVRLRTTSSSHTVKLVLLPN